MTERIHDLCRLIESAERDDDLDRLMSVSGRLYAECIHEKLLPDWDRQRETWAAEACAAKGDAI